MSNSQLVLFRHALGEAAWNRLAPAIRRHYLLGSETIEELELQGVMEVHHAAIIKPFLLLAQAFDALVPRRGQDIPVTVRNRTDPATPLPLYWHRTFQFPDGRSSVFQSRMIPGQPGEVIELLKFGVGIRMRVAERDASLVYTAIEHCWVVGPWVLGIPNWLMLGTASITESADGEDELKLDFSIRHPWLGRTFGYNGRFRFSATRSVSR